MRTIRDGRYVAASGHLGSARAAARHADRRPWQTVLAVVLATSCQWSEDRFAKRNLSSHELYGRWVATDYAIKSLYDVGVRDHLNREDHILIIRRNGSCSIRTVFTLPPAPDGRSSYRVYDDGCSWSLETSALHGRRRQYLQLELKNNERSISFNLAEENNEIIIWQYADDPDAWRYLEFSRAPRRLTSR